MVLLMPEQLTSLKPQVKGDPAPSQAITKPIKTGVVGYGFSAKTFHLPFICALKEFDLCAISSSQQAAVRGAFKDVVYHTTPEQMAAQEDLELIIITAPNKVHFKLAKQALEAGKHVVLEKPFVLSSPQGRELIELAESKELVLSVYHNRRWDGDFLTVKRLIESGQLGDIICYESHFDRFRPEVRKRWREQDPEGGGLLWDLAPHLIDQALQLFGRPDALTASIKTLRPSGVTTDYFHIQLHYVDKEVILHADMLNASPNKRFSVRGTKGSYEKLGLDPQESDLINGVCPSDENWGKESELAYGSIYNAEAKGKVETERGCYAKYFTQLARAIKEQLPAPVCASEALAVIKLIELAILSNEKQQTLSC